MPLLLLPLAAAALASGRHALQVQDPLLGNVTRHYWLDVPAEAPQGGHAVLLGFHGQSGAPKSWRDGHTFTQLANGKGWLAAYLEGKADSSPRDSGWNCGTAGDNATCLPGTNGTECHTSCRRLGLCGRCNWSSCYDEAAFVKQLLSALHAAFVLDGRYFAVGESNGAMAVHHLIQRLPGLFLGAAPVFGQPLLGYQAGGRYELLTEQAKARRTSILHLHDRSDVTIPWQGGQSEDGWLYEPVRRVLGAWAAVKDCRLAPEPAKTNFDGGPLHLRCVEYVGCAVGRIAECKYDGEHGDWLDGERGELMIMEFFESLAQSSTPLIA